MAVVRPDHVLGLWDHLGKEVGFRVADKRDSALMSTAGRLVEVVTRGKQSAEDFLRRYVTTLPLPPPWGLTVFAPFALGVPTPEWSLESQFSVAPHEAQHGVQWLRDGVSWVVLYGLPTDEADGSRGAADRARFETEAKEATETVRWAVRGTTSGYEANAAGLSSYGCSVGDVRVSAEELRLADQTIRAGGISTSAARLAIDWRNKFAPELVP